MLDSMRHIGADVMKFLAGVSNVVLATTVLLPLIGFALGYGLAPSVSSANTRFLLSGLAGAQAAVLAIVFSVTVIGI